MTGKLRYGLSVWLGVVLVVFLLFQRLGDPSRLLAGQSGDAQTRANIRKSLHLDDPLWKQFVFYLNDLSPIAVHSAEDIRSKELKGLFWGNGRYCIGLKWPYLGRSYQSGEPVTRILGAALPGTLLLAFLSLLLATSLGIPMGITAALKKGGLADRSLVTFSVVGISAPSFFMALLLGYLLGIRWHAYTGLNFTGSLLEIDERTGQTTWQLKNVVLPMLTLALRPLSMIVPLTRSAMLDVLGQDYIRTAKAKGLDTWTIVRRHALRNAMNPVVTGISGWFGELLAGAFFVEFIFGWRGMGKTTIDALEKLDFPVVSGAVLVSAGFFLLVQVLSDRLQRALDPRIG